MTQSGASDRRHGSRKPNVTEAMRLLIAEIRDRIPFDLPASRVCGGDCQGCAMKPLQFLEGELDAWEGRLAAGERPGFEQLSELIRAAREVYRVLERRGLVDG